VYVHGVDKDKWRTIIALLLPIDDVYGGALGTLIGAWIGAVPIPLDWFVPKISQR
jgi:phosphatidylinositol glycan class F